MFGSIYASIQYPVSNISLNLPFSRRKFLETTLLVSVLPAVPIIAIAKSKDKTNSSMIASLLQALALLIRVDSGDEDAADGGGGNFTINVQKSTFNITINISNNTEAGVMESVCESPEDPTLEDVFECEAVCPDGSISIEKQKKQ